MLEMSNGYPSSPLGASPSPSPGLGGHHSKCKLSPPFTESPCINKIKSFPAHHIIHKQHSPGGGATGRSTNLRVVIPTPITSNMNTDDMSYAEVSFYQ